MLYGIGVSGISHQFLQVQSKSKVLGSYQQIKCNISLLLKLQYLLLCGVEFCHFVHAFQCFEIYSFNRAKEVYLTL